MSTLNVNVNQDVVQSTATDSYSLKFIEDYVVSAIKQVFNWVVDCASSLLGGIETLVLREIPTSLGLDNIFTPALVDLVTSWVPIGYAISCFVAYLSIAFTIWLINWILGIIPTMS